MKTISQTGLFSLAIKDCISQGTNIQTAMRYGGPETRRALLTMVGQVAKYVDAKKGLETAHDYALCVDMLIKDFPSLTIEEFRLVFDRMQTGYYGDYYERLKAGDFRKCFLKHEKERVDAVRELNSTHKQDIRYDPAKITYNAEEAMLKWKQKRNPFYIKGKSKQDGDK